MLDGVHGAGRPGAVLVGGAGIIYIFPALAPGDGFPTVRTFQKAAEQMELPALGGGASGYPGAGGPAPGQRFRG